MSNRVVFSLSALVRESVGSISFVGLALLLGGLAISAPAGNRAVEWPFYSGDQAATNYSPPTQINKQNVSRPIPFAL